MCVRSGIMLKSLKGALGAIWEVAGVLLMILAVFLLALFSV